MTNIIKTVLKAFLGVILAVILAAAAVVAIVPAHEKTFSCGWYKMPVYVDGMHYVTDIEKTVTISWDIISNDSKHFSIEQFYAGDINSSFVISHNRHCYESEYYHDVWYTLDIELYKDIDEAWLNIEIKL